MKQGENEHVLSYIHRKFVSGISVMPNVLSSPWSSIKFETILDMWDSWLRCAKNILHTVPPNNYLGVSGYFVETFALETVYQSVEEIFQHKKTAVMQPDRC